MSSSSSFVSPLTGAFGQPVDASEDPGILDGPRQRGLVGRPAVGRLGLQLHDADAEKGEGSVTR